MRQLLSPYPPEVNFLQLISRSDSNGKSRKNCNDRHSLPNTSLGSGKLPKKKKKIFNII